MGLGARDIYFIRDWDIQWKVHLKLKQKSNTNKLYSTDLHVYEIINKPTTNEHSLAKLKYINTFSVTESLFEKLDLLPRVLSLNNRLKEFQFKILHRYIAKKGLLLIMKIIKDKLCTFSKREEETIEHVFYNCDIVVAFWLDFESYYRDEYMNGHLKQKL